MKKRILIFSTAYFPFVGGAEVALKKITDGLGDYEFDLITARMSKDIPVEEVMGNVHVYRVGVGNATWDKFFLLLWGHRLGVRLHQKQAYDAVWAMMASYGGFAALSLKKKLRIPFLLTLQEGDPIEQILHKVRFVRFRFNQIFRCADALQAISTYLLNWGETMGFAGKVKEVVPNGVDISQFTKKYSLEELDAVRREFGFAGDSVVLITASRLVVKNGVEHVIRALPLLPEKVCFVICGVGDLESSLRDLVRDLHLESRVRFLGNVSHDRLPVLLATSDMFIRPSLTEGLGNSFLEAMAVGLPTIGTPVGGIPDFLVEGETGFLCEPSSPESIATTVNKILVLSPEQKKNVHENALKIIYEKYNWEYVCAHMKNLFEQL